MSYDNNNINNTLIFKYQLIIYFKNLSQKALLNPGSFTTWAIPFSYLGKAKLKLTSSISVALAASTNENCSRSGLTIVLTKPSTVSLDFCNKALTSNPLTFEAANPAPHNSFASNLNSKQKDKNAFKAFNLSTWFSNFFWNLAFSNLTSFRALIREVKRYLAPVEFPLTDNTNCRAFKDNSSSGAVKNSSGRNSDLNDAFKLWKSEIFTPNSKRGCKNYPLTLTKSTETLFPDVLKWTS